MSLNVDTCPSCFSEIEKDEKIVVFPCKHKVHKDCFEKLPEDIHTSTFIKHIKFCWQCTKPIPESFYAPVIKKIKDAENKQELLNLVKATGAVAFSAFFAKYFDLNPYADPASAILYASLGSVMAALQELYERKASKKVHNRIGMGTVLGSMIGTISKDSIRTLRSAWGGFVNISAGYMLTKGIIIPEIEIAIEKYKLWRQQRAQLREENEIIIEQ